MSALIDLLWTHWVEVAIWLVLNTVAIAVAIYRGHGVDRTLAWIFAIAAIPFLGAVAYFLFARPSVRRATRRRRDATQSVRRHVFGRDDAAAVKQKAEPRIDRLEQSLLCLAHELTGLSPTAGNRVELLAADTRAFERMEDALRSAEQSIWAEYYLIRNDTTGARFLHLLAKKAREGVDVRLLYDAVGSLGLGSKRLEAIRRAGGRVEAFLPLNPLRRRWSVHLRNHRKLIVVDGQTGFTGGMNVSDEYSGRARRRGHWHCRDGHLALHGPAVADLAQTFVEDWAFATDEMLPLPQRPAAVENASSVVAIIPSGPDQRPNASSMTYFAGIAAARKRIYLSTPYFIPDEPTLRALLSAALRGLDVRILVPAKNDVRLVGAAARTYYSELVQGGVRIYEYQPSMLHSKTIVVDGTWGMVGSANVDIRSFRLNFELSALVVDPVFAKVMEKQFRRDLEDSRELTEEILEQTSVLGKLRDRTFRLLSPLL